MDAKLEALRRLGALVVGTRVGYQTVEPDVVAYGEIVEVEAGGAVVRVLFDKPVDENGARWLSMRTTTLSLRSPQ
jgi:hypothetical protein